DQCEHVLDIAAMPVETAEELEGLVHRDLLGELGLLQVDPEALAQVTGMAAPAEAEHFDLAGIGRGEPLADLDGGGLPRAVRTEEAKAFTGVDGKVEAVHRHYVAVVLVEVPDPQGGGFGMWSVHRHLPKISASRPPPRGPGRRHPDFWRVFPSPECLRGRKISA